jgi:hypothetical protein
LQTRLLVQRLAAARSKLLNLLVSFNFFFTANDKINIIMSKPLADLELTAFDHTHHLSLPITKYLSCVLQIQLRILRR